MRKTVIKMVFIVCIFALISLGITKYAINKSNKNEIITEEITEETTEETVEEAVAETEKTEEERIEKGIDLDGTYDENDLVINEKIEEYKGAEVKFPELSGLKNKDVEEKINKEIYERCKTELEKYDAINHASFYLRGNFANTVSISFYIGTETTGKQMYLNYELTEGKRIEFEDLFKADTDVTEIVREAVYNSMVADGYYMSEGSIVSPDENRFYKTVKGFMNDEDKEFSFSPAEIYIYYDDVTAGIKMIDIADEVVIYSKYLKEESIFENNNIGHDNVFTCVDSSQFDAFEVLDFGFAEDNLWYDISVWSSFIPEDIPEETVEKYKDFAKNEYNKAYETVKEYRNIAKANKDKFYILLLRPVADMYYSSVYEDGKWNNTPSNVAVSSENTQIFEMDMSVYDAIYKEKIKETYRYQYFAMRGGAWFDLNQPDGADITQKISEKLYNIYTGEEYTDIEDVFAENSGYEELIKERAERFIEYHEFSDEYEEYLLESMKYEIKGNGIKVTFDDGEEMFFIMGFNEFEKEWMKIY